MSNAPDVTKESVFNIATVTANCVDGHFMKIFPAFSFFNLRYHVDEELRDITTSVLISCSMLYFFRDTVRVCAR